MTVEELIDELEKYKPDDEVLVMTSPLVYTNISHVSLLETGKEVLIELSGLYYAKLLKPPY